VGSTSSTPGAGPLEVGVPVGLSTIWGDEYFVQNVTTRPSTWGGSYRAWRQPPTGYQLQPGEQVELNYTTDSPWLGDTTFELRASSSSAGADVWHAIEEGVTPETPSGSLNLQGFECGSSGGNAGCVESSSDGRRLLLGDAPGVYGYTKDISGAEDALAKLTQMADNYVDVLTVRWIKTQFLDRGEVLSH